MNGIKQFKQSLEITGEVMVGASRFERPTSCSQGRRANQAALRPDISNANHQNPSPKQISRKSPTI